MGPRRLPLLTSPALPAEPAAAAQVSPGSPLTGAAAGGAPQQGPRPPAQPRVSVCPLREDGGVSGQAAPAPSPHLSGQPAGSPEGRGRPTDRQTDSRKLPSAAGARGGGARTRVPLWLSRERSARSPRRAPHLPTATRRPAARVTLPPRVGVGRGQLVGVSAGSGHVGYGRELSAERSRRRPGAGGAAGAAAGAAGPEAEWRAAYIAGRPGAAAP